MDVLRIFEGGLGFLEFPLKVSNGCLEVPRFSSFCGGFVVVKPKLRLEKKCT